MKKDCKKCKWYIGRAPKRKGNPVFGGSTHMHCRKGYSCDAFKFETSSAKGKNNATYNGYEE